MSKQERLKELAQAYKEAEEKFTYLKDELGFLKAHILAELPEEPDEHIINIGDGHYMTVRIPEKWSWDKRVLKAIYQNVATPDCVNTSFTVDRKKYEASPEEVQQELINALTIECGTATFKVS
jgi:hypothetical protein